MHGEFDAAPKGSRPAHEFAGFDYQQPDHRRNAEKLWAELRDHPGLARSEQHGGYYIASRFEDVVRIVQDYRTFSSASGIGIPEVHTGARLIPTETDPPLQRAYRKVVSRFLAPAAIFPLERQLRLSARGLINKFVGASEIDIVDVFARPFPILFMLDYLGLPLDDGPMLDTWIKHMLTERGTPQASQATSGFHHYVSHHLDEHRAAPDREHILGAIVTGEVDGRPLEVEEQIALLSLLIHGGFTTTTFAISGAMRWLADHPADLRRLRQEPELVDTAVEEFVRRSSPAAYLARVPSPHRSTSRIVRCARGIEWWWRTERRTSIRASSNTPTRSCLIDHRTCTSALASARTDALGSTLRVSSSGSQCRRCSITFSSSSLIRHARSSTRAVRFKEWWPFRYE